MLPALLARRLRIPTTALKYAAVVAMELLLRNLYRMTQKGDCVCCAATKEYRLQCCLGTMSNYMVFVEWDCDLVLRAIRPWGLGTFSGDVSKSLNRRHTMSIVREMEGHLHMMGWPWVACGSKRRLTRESALLE